MTETTLPQYTGQPTIVEFLKARLDERWRDEMPRLYGSAKIQVAAHPSQRTGDRLVTCHDCDWFTEGPAGETRAATDQHLRDEHDDMRVLADIAAKRAIIGLAEEASALDAQVDSEFRVGFRDLSSEPYVGDLILRRLASIDRDHPDYRQEWAV